jgi:hypothetical protein
MKSPIERREFGKVILSSALSAAAAGAQTPKPRSARLWRPCGDRRPFPANGGRARVSVAYTVGYMKALQERANAEFAV